GGEMHALDQGIGGHRQLFASGQLQQGAVVTDTEHHAFATPRTGRGGEVMADQLELTHGPSVPRSAPGCLDFRFAQHRRELVQHTVDELVAIGGTEDLGQLDTFVDHHAIRYVDTLDELPGGQAQHRQLDRVEL